MTEETLSGVRPGSLRWSPNPSWSLATKVRLLGEILQAYVVSRRLLRNSDLPQAVMTLRRGPVYGPVTDADIRLGRRLGAAVVRTLSALPTDSRCLVQSLVLTRMLASRGVSARLVIGAKLDPEFSAHAWVEAGNIALLPADGYRDARLTEL